MTKGYPIRSALLWPKLGITTQIAATFNTFRLIYASETHFSGFLQHSTLRMINRPEVHFYIQRAPPAYSAGGAVSYASKTVSRVLYLTVIYLDTPLPTCSSHLPEAAGPTCCFLHGVAPDRVYSDGQSPAVGCALTAPFHPYLVDTNCISP